MTPLYITHTSAITPQHQDTAALLQPLLKDIDRKFYVQEPDYPQVIPAMQLRRMSKVLKMGVYCGMDCLSKSGIEKPDGIITGTGKGSMTDTEKFVKELKQYNEEAMNPTPFILSTYNAINGAIALQTKATGYNQTFVHRGSSFEVSLYDAQLKLHKEQEEQHYLVGCFDEITPEYFSIKDKIGYWKKDRDTAIPLWGQSGSKGTIAGEGSAFFMLSNKPGEAIAAIHTIDTLYKPSEEELEQTIRNAIAKAGWHINEIDMLVLGLNGDKEDLLFYESAQQQFAETIPVMAFKHLCGEYETSGGFALWLACQYFSGTVLPEDIWYKKPKDKDFAPRKILYYNHYRGWNHNVLLLSKEG